MIHQCQFFPLSLHTYTFFFFWHSLKQYSMTALIRDLVQFDTSVSTLWSLYSDMKHTDFRLGFESHTFRDTFVQWDQCWGSQVSTSSTTLQGVLIFKLMFRFSLNHIHTPWCDYTLSHNSYPYVFTTCSHQTHFLSPPDSFTPWISMSSFSHFGFIGRTFRYFTLVSVSPYLVSD